jgi:hypothetical protein
LISGVEDISAESGLYVFPNPANEEIVIHSSFIPVNETTSISLINVLGEIVQTANVDWSDQVILNIETLPSGIYTLSVEADAQKLTARFFKE